jgi:endoglucanase
MRVPLIAILIAGLALPASASETISLRRGLPTDIWVTWPEAETLGDAQRVDVFPEYRQSYQGQEFGLAREAGFDFIRLTIDPAVFLWEPSEVKTARLIAGMKIAIAEIREAGLKVVVDLHSVPRADPSPGTRQILRDDDSFASYLKVVEAVGRAIADLPAGEVAFEPLNEPTLDCSYDMTEGEKPRWPAMLVKMHAAARMAAPDTTIILSGGCWGGAEGLVALDPKTIDDANVTWSFHNYEPFLFSHQGASWTDGYEPFVSGIRYPPRADDKQRLLLAAKTKLAESDLSAERKAELEKYLSADFDAYFSDGWAEARAIEPFAKVALWASKHGISANRIMLGEFGAIRDDVSVVKADEKRATLYKLLRSNAEERGWAWSTWSWSGSFGVSSTTTSRDFSPIMMKALGLNAP